MTDKQYMERAIELAQKAIGFTNPNPMVGAVIVKNNKIIGEGYHRKCGEFHAERNAFANLSESAEGATLYVTLEPCCHYGKTPPCTEAIIENQIARVVIGSRDPNPLVSGKGAKLLKEHGILVEEDFMREECDRINPVFFHYITSKTPYVTMKYAMTMDGKIATRTGKSKWITGEAARNEVQHMRHRNMAILSGIGTVLADDPMLNVRVKGLKSPIRVICDSMLRIPLDSQIVRTADSIPTIIACANEDPLKISELTKRNIQVEVVRGKDGRTDLSELLNRLGSRGIDSVFVEAGAVINESFLRLGLVDRIEAFVAPKIFGGEASKGPIGGEGIDEVSKAPLFELTDMRKIGEDVLLTYQKRNEGN